MNRKNKKLFSSLCSSKLGELGINGCADLLFSYCIRKPTIGAVTYLFLRSFLSLLLLTVLSLGYGGSTVD